MDRKDKNNFNDIGKEIRDAVQDAVSSMDFAQLNRQITESVNEALDEIQNAFRENAGFASGTDRASTDSRREQGTQSEARRQAEREKERAREAARRQAEREQARERAREAARRQIEQAREEARRKREQNSQTQRETAGHRAQERMKEEAARVRGELHRRADLIARRPKGSVSQVLFTVFGSVLLGLGILLALLFGTIALTGEIELSAIWILLGLVVAPVGGGGIWMLIRGARNRGRVERFRAYTACIKDRYYLKISDMAAAVHKSEKYVIRDLKKMIELGMFPQGHISEEQNLFILDDATFAEYETMRLEVENRSKAMQAETREQQQLRETVERGQDYLAAIRKANDAIPGAEISQKLTRLEKAVDRIYVQIRKCPEKLPELRRFQEYYLPTTLKLVETYREFDAQPIAGENITTAKQEIEASLDTINQAFEKLFDSLFADTAMDVSTDISVLQTLLAQEGLTEEVWKAATEPDDEYLRQEAAAGTEGLHASMEARH